MVPNAQTEPHSNQTSSQHRPLRCLSPPNPINSAKSPICSFSSWLKTCPEIFPARALDTDNDHASIADIQILPTAREIASPRQEYLPLIDSTQNHLSGLAGTPGQTISAPPAKIQWDKLRDAVREEVTRLEQS